MSRPLNDTELAIASGRHMAQAMDLLVGALTAPRAVPRPVPVPAPTHWSEFTLEDAGWCLHLGYSASGDRADDGDIRIVRIILNTGQRDINLTPGDLDRDTFFACEEQCREEWRASYEVQP